MASQNAPKQVAVKDDNPVVEIGHRRSVHLQTLIRQTLGVRNLDDAALDSGSRTLISNNGSLVVNPTADAVDWFGWDAGDNVRIRKFPDAVLITRERGADDEF
jgi:hypothetical protein